MKSKPFDFIRNLIVAETKSDDFEKVLDAGQIREIRAQLCGNFP